MSQEDSQKGSKKAPDNSSKTEHWTDDSWQPPEEDKSREWTGLLPQQEVEESEVDWSTFEEEEVEKLSFEEKQRAQRPQTKEKSIATSDSIDDSEGESKKVPIESSKSLEQEVVDSTQSLSESSIAQGEKEEIAKPLEEAKEADHLVVHPVEIDADTEGSQEDRLKDQPQAKFGERELFGPPPPPKPLIEAPKPLSMKQKIEAILFAAPHPMKTSEIAEVLMEEAPKARALRQIIEEIQSDYEELERGFHLIKVGETYQFRTKLAAAPLMERMFSSRPRPLSRAAQETLAIIAYRQPVTRADIEFIRGVDAGSIIKNLLERDLIHCVGRREISGRPMLFGTTDEFLAIYQLSKIEDLPPLASFQPNYDTRETLAALNLDEEVDITEFVDDKATTTESPPEDMAQ